MSNAVVDAFVGRTYQRRRRPQHWLLISTARLETVQERINIS